MFDFLPVFWCWSRLASQPERFSFLLNQFEFWNGNYPLITNGNKHKQIANFIKMILQDLNWTVYLIGQRCWWIWWKWTWWEFIQLIHGWWICRDRANTFPMYQHIPLPSRSHTPRTLKETISIWKEVQNILKSNRSVNI